MNIQKLEVVLDEMRRANFEDAASAERLVRKWADQIGDAISEHLIAELGGEAVRASRPRPASPRNPVATTGTKTPDPLR